ncbi:MAG: NAD(P)/FAD-dependent oxidoreductase [Steroidobacteraceae bacterium]
MSDPDFDLIGAGPAGLLMALLLARRGARVAVYERRADPRSSPPEAGRSINLALAARGLRALEAAALLHVLDDQLVAMPGRQVHDANGSETFIPYGQGPHERIHSISRATLTLRLTEAAANAAGIDLHFGHRCNGVDTDGHPQIERADGSTVRLSAPRCIAADGAGSAVRKGMVAAGFATAHEDLLDHDYKELLIPAGGELAREALHIWPRGGFMLIALPNADGSFTATLFLARRGADSFETLRDDASVERFFAGHFPDVAMAIPDLARQFRAHPQGILGTVTTTPWNLGERLLLIGDAAHAIVPFHGQGMNCAFEDCRLLDAELARDSGNAFARFARTRPTDTGAIATMALENYVEMRDGVRDPRFLLHKSLSLELERRHPDRFVPRYAMVMFRADVPYSRAQARGEIQQRLLDELTRETHSLDAVDFDAADRLVVGRLPPLSADRA